jgi:hypothetical protein
MIGLYEYAVTDGASSLLCEIPGRRVYADPVGHPFGVCTA